MKELVKLEIKRLENVHEYLRNVKQFYKELSRRLRSFEDFHYDKLIKFSFSPEDFYNDMIRTNLEKKMNPIKSFFTYAHKDLMKLHDDLKCLGNIIKNYKEELIDEYSSKKKKETKIKDLDIQLYRDVIIKYRKFIFHVQRGIFITIKKFFNIMNIDVNDKFFTNDKMTYFDIIEKNIMDTNEKLQNLTFKLDENIYKENKLQSYLYAGLKEETIYNSNLKYGEKQNLNRNDIKNVNKKEYIESHINRTDCSVVINLDTKASRNYSDKKNSQNNINSKKNKTSCSNVNLESNLQNDNYKKSGLILENYTYNQQTKKINKENTNINRNNNAYNTSNSTNNDLKSELSKLKNQSRSRAKFDSSSNNHINYGNNTSCTQNISDKNNSINNDSKTLRCNNLYLNTNDNLSCSRYKHTSNLNKNQNKEEFKEIDDSEGSDFNSADNYNYKHQNNDMNNDVNSEYNNIESD